LKVIFTIDEKIWNKYLEWLSQHSKGKVLRKGDISKGLREAIMNQMGGNFYE